jgi:hypothetical protein
MASWIFNVLVDKHSLGGEMVQAQQIAGGQTFFRRRMVQA